MKNSSFKELKENGLDVFGNRNIPLLRMTFRVEHFFFTFGK